MNPRRRAVVAAIKLCDLAVVAAALVVATLASTGSDGPRTWPALLEMRLSLANIALVAAYLGLWHVTFRACGLYQSYRLAAARRELRDLATAVALAVLPLAALAPLLGIDVVDGPFLIVFASAAFAALTMSRRLLRAVGRRVRLYGRDLRNVVVVGTGDEALELTARLARRNDVGYQVVAVIDCGSGEPTEALHMVAALVDQGQIDEVFVALALDTSQALVGRIVGLCEEQGITVRLASQVTALYWARAVIDEIDGQPIITVHSGPAEGPGLVAKRALDVAVAGAGLLLCAPLFALCALAIRLDSRGPVFFGQERVGLNRRRFRVWKFRTMVADAEARQAGLEARNEADGPVFKITADPRVTRVGRWLRRSSIDELPQLWNVLRSEMSLVGPRPLPLRDVERIDVRWHRRRFSVKPGITCLWQVESRAPRFDEWIALDMQYIDNWSLGLDLKILARTIPAVLSGQGAR